MTIIGTVAMSGLPVAAAPIDIVPSFGTVTTGAQAPGVWYTDRYAPEGFANVGTQFGRTDVLGIDIDTSDQQGARPSNFSGSFYNTQGRKYDINAAGAVRAQADLYIPDSWGDDDNGFRRTDIWGTLTTGNPADPVDSSYTYPILGFTNYGGPARFRAWDGTSTNGWVDFGVTVNYDAWNTLAWIFDPVAQTVEYLVNGVVAYTDSVFSYAPQVTANIIMQAFNFGDDFGPNASPTYTAYWSNTPAAAVPTPATVLLIVPALLGLAAIRRRLV